MNQKAFPIFTALILAVTAMSQPLYNSVTTIHPTVGSYTTYPTTGTRTVEYFMHGNILSLKRNGRLADGTIPGVSTEYAYDANGNITRNADKGIVSVEYDDRNMPKRITFTSGQTTEYTYSTDGRKWRVSYGFGSAPVTAPMLTVMDGGSELMAADNRQTVDYCGNVIYRNGQLERILIEDGYITYESGSYKYHYYIKDHLGNNRVVIDDNKAVEQVVHYYPFGAQFLDGMGTDTQPYKYNGKELDRMNGLDWYDYGARFYDASLGRWGTIDPLAEKYYDISPYVYCHNNPINRIDYRGYYDFENIHDYTYYPVIAVFQSNRDKILEYDYQVAKNVGMPIFVVDGINDFKDALDDFISKGSSFQTVAINSHGSLGSFKIGDDTIDMTTDLYLLHDVLEGKFVFIGACNVGESYGQYMVEGLAQQTSSTVIAACHKINAGYKYDGGNGLNNLEGKSPYIMNPATLKGNKFIYSNNGFDAKSIRNVTINKFTGINWDNIIFDWTLNNTFRWWY